MEEQKNNKGSVFVAESAYNAPNAQFGLVMNLKKYFLRKVKKFQKKVEKIESLDFLRVITDCV